MKKAWILGIAGVLVTCVLSEAKASPTQRTVRYLSEDEIKNYIELINGSNPCETLNQLAKRYKVTPCHSCSATEAGLSSCFSVFYKEIKEKYGPKRKEYGFNRDEIDEILTQACSTTCTSSGCQNDKIKKTCGVFCGFANDEGIKGCP